MVLTLQWAWEQRNKTIYEKLVSGASCQHYICGPREFYLRSVMVGIDCHLDGI